MNWGEAKRLVQHPELRAQLPPSMPSRAGFPEGSVFVAQVRYENGSRQWLESPITVPQKVCGSLWSATMRNSWENAQDEYGQNPP